MTCPVCKGKDARRSRRQNLTDYAVSVFGVVPWRCRLCESRFHARPMSLTDSLRAHCPVCGNLELQRISGDRVDSRLAFLWRRLSIPAYRCEPCRYKYFSIRPVRAKERELTEAASSK